MCAAQNAVLSNIDGGFLAFCRSQFCEGWRRQPVWQFLALRHGQHWQNMIRVTSTGKKSWQFGHNELDMG